jgi:hypothetical protein
MQGGSMTKEERQEEIQNEIDWFLGLKETILIGRLDIAVDAINAAIKMLEREK